VRLGAPAGSPHGGRTLRLFYVGNRRSLIRSGRNGCKADIEHFAPKRPKLIDVIAAGEFWRGAPMIPGVEGGGLMKRFVSVLGIASLMTAPAAASVREAAFSSSADRARAETSMFIGMNYGVALDRKTNAREARASLKLARMVKTPGAQFRVGEGLGLAAGVKGKAAFLVGGQEIDIKGGKANLSTAGTIAIAVVGVLAIGAVGAYYALRDPCDHKECE